MLQKKKKKRVDLEENLEKQNVPEKQKIKRQKEEQKGEPRTRFEKLKLYYFVF